MLLLNANHFWEEFWVGKNHMKIDPWILSCHSISIIVIVLTQLHLLVVVGIVFAPVPPSKCRASVCPSHGSCEVILKHWSTHLSTKKAAMAEEGQEILLPLDWLRLLRNCALGKEEVKLKWWFRSSHSPSYQMKQEFTSNSRAFKGRCLLICTHHRTRSTWGN